MSAAQVLLRLLLFPGGVGALVLGLAARGVAAWLGARFRGRPAPPVWGPFAELARLARKRAPEGTPTAVAWAGLLAVAGLTVGAALLPWPEGHAGPEGDLVFYLMLFPLPALARLLAAGFSGSPDAAWGARRQAPLEVARLLPLLWGSAALPLATRDLGLASGAATSPLGTAVLLLLSGLLLATLPWPLWDRDRRHAPLAGFGGRWLAVYRAVEALELTLQVGLTAVALRAGRLFPPAQSWVALLAAFVGAVLVLAGFEAGGRELPLEAAVHRYTRWLAPFAFLLTLFAAWAGR